jgi:hypothetical protein
MQLRYNCDTNKTIFSQLRYNFDTTATQPTAIQLQYNCELQTTAKQTHYNCITTVSSTTAYSTTVLQLCIQLQYQQP